MVRRYTPADTGTRDGRTTAKDSYDPEAWKAWANEPKLQRGRPYDGAVERDGQIIIPK